MADTESKRRGTPALLAFAGRLEAARRSYGTQTDRPHITKDQFAQDLGVGRAAYYRYERGEVQPPLSLLEALRRITGISLDWIVAGLPRGSDPIHPMNGRRVITVGDRLRWARETQEPWVNAVAAVMNVTPAQWQAYEEDKIPLPMEKGDEFAHRFSVSLDYLYRGRLVGIAPRVLSALLAAHPELQEPVGGGDAPTTAMSNAFRMLA